MRKETNWTITATVVWLILSGLGVLYFLYSEGGSLDGSVLFSAALVAVVSTVLFANPNVREIFILIRTDFLVLLNPLFPAQWLEGQNIAIVCPSQPFRSQLVYHLRVSG